MAKHNEIGQLGENLACQYLEKKGYTILEKNWHTRNFEVDIIAIKSEVIIFVEVKTRSSVYFGSPEIFVSHQKQRNLIAAAQRYVDINQRKEEVQFDIVAIVFEDKKSNIQHIENAFQCSWR